MHNNSLFVRTKFLDRLKNYPIFLYEGRKIGIEDAIIHEGTIIGLIKFNNINDCLRSRIK